jgi:hypothetical protein
VIRHENGIRFGVISQKGFQACITDGYGFAFQTSIGVNRGGPTFVHGSSSHEDGTLDARQAKSIYATVAPSE